jgi:hypothetical protein
MKTKESLHLERISFGEEILSDGKKMEGVAVLLSTLYLIILLSELLFNI